MRQFERISNLERTHCESIPKRLYRVRSQQLNSLHTIACVQWRLGGLPTSETLVGRCKFAVCVVCKCPIDCASRPSPVCGYLRNLLHYICGTSFVILLPWCTIYTDPLAYTEHVTPSSKASLHTDSALRMCGGVERINLGPIFHAKSFSVWMIVNNALRDINWFGHTQCK
jgi:hypothetical protein